MAETNPRVQIPPATPEVDAPIVVVGKGQEPEFVQIRGAMVTAPGFATKLIDLTPDAVPTPCRFNSVLYAFKPTEEQLARLLEGEDIYVSLLTFGQPVQGIMVFAGKDAAAAVFNVKPNDAQLEEELQP